MGKTIVIANQKGGVGKTTTALEICSCLKAKKKNVILIDFDQQCNSTFSMGVEEKNTIYDVFKEKCALPDAIQKACGFDGIAGDARLSELGETFSLNQDNDNIYLLTDVCDALKEQYDFVVIDTHPDRNLALNMAYAAADYVIVPSDASKYSLDGIVEIENDIAKLRNTRSKISHAHIIGLLLIANQNNNVDSVALDILSDIAAAIDGDVFVDSVRISTKVKQSTYSVGTMQNYDKKGNAATDYRRITKKIINRAVEE